MTRRPRWPGMAWALITWSVTILLWAVAVHRNAYHDAVHDCIQAGTTALRCRSESHDVALFHVLVIVIIGVAGFVVLTIVSTVTARQRPPGPRHGVDPPLPRR